MQNPRSPTLKMALPLRNNKSAATSNKNMTRTTIHDLYLNDIVYRDARERHKGHENLQPTVVDYLSEVEHQSKLSPEYMHVIHTSVKDNPDWNPYRAYEAFLHLEKFALNLLDHPWKKEYRTLKLYSGHYQVHINPHLKNTEEIFFLMGYEEHRPLVLTLGPHNHSRLTEAACDCFIAAVECLVMLQIINKVSYTNCTILDVYSSRIKCRGGIVKCVKWITSKYLPVHDKANVIMNLNNSPKKKVAAETNVINAKDLEEHILVSDNDMDILPVVNNQHYELKEHNVERLKAEESKKPEKNKKQSRSLDDLLGVKSKIRSMSLRRGGSADGEMKGGKNRHERALNRSKELEDGQIATTLRPKSSSLSRSKKSSRSSSKSTLSDIEPNDTSIPLHKREHYDTNSSSDTNSSHKKECIGPDEMYNHTEPPVNGMAIRQFSTDSAGALTSEEYDIFQMQSHDDHLRKQLKSIENMAKSPKADHLHRFSLPPFDPNIDSDRKPSQKSCYFDDIDNLPRHGSTVSSDVKRHKSHEQLGEASWQLPVSNERSESLSQLGAVGGAQSVLDRQRPGSMYENLGGHTNFEDVHCDFRPRGDSLRNHRPRVENVVIMKSRSQGSSPTYNSPELGMTLSQRGSAAGAAVEEKTVDTLMEDDIAECDSDEDDLEDCTPFAKLRQDTSSHTDEALMSASMVASMAASDGSGPASDSSVNDPFVENCSQCSSSTVKRGENKSDIIEHQFRSMLLAKDEHPTNSYTPTTFSTFGKDRGPDPFATIPPARAPPRTSSLGYATCVDAGEESGWPDVLENTPKSNKPPSPPPRTVRASRETPPTMKPLANHHINDYMKPFTSKSQVKSPPTAKRNGVILTKPEEKLLPPPRKGKLRGGDRTGLSTRSSGVVVSDGCMDDKLSQDLPPPPPPLDSVNQPDWQCLKCTYSNTADNPVCQMCHRSQEPGPESARVQSGSPICPTCTFMNEAGAGQCMMCETELGKGGTFI